MTLLFFSPNSLPVPSRRTTMLRGGSSGELWAAGMIVAALAAACELATGCNLTEGERGRTGGADASETAAGADSAALEVCEPGAGGDSAGLGAPCSPWRERVKGDSARALSSGPTAKWPQLAISYGMVRLRK